MPDFERTPAVKVYLYGPLHKPSWAYGQEPHEARENKTPTPVPDIQYNISFEDAMTHDVLPVLLGFNATPSPL